MGDTVITIVAIFLAAILMFIFPLMAISERNDDIVQSKVQVAISNLVYEVSTTGKLTEQAYSKFIGEIEATGNSFEIEIEAQILDENPTVKGVSAQQKVIGENTYYSIFTSTIESALQQKQVKYFKEGDIFSVTVKNTNKTLAQSLQGAFGLANDTYTVAASASAVVATDGN